MKGTGAAYGVMQRKLPLMHADLRTGIVEQVRVEGNTLHVFTDLMTPEMRGAILQTQRQEFLGAGPGRGVPVCTIAAQAGVTDDAGAGGDMGAGMTLLGRRKRLLQQGHTPDRRSVSLTPIPSLRNQHHGRKPPQ